MSRLLSLSLPLLLAGCGTFSGTFVRIAPDFSTVPEADLRALALEIEQAVWAGNREPDLDERAGIVLNAEVRQAIRTRAARNELLREFMGNGYGWEIKNGLLEITRTAEYKQATTRRGRDRDALLVMSENQNRWTIYEGIRKDSKFPPKALSAIQGIFFEARIEALPDGLFYEGPDGAPVCKGK